MERDFACGLTVFASMTQRPSLLSGLFIVLVRLATWRPMNPPSIIYRVENDVLHFVTDRLRFHNSQIVFKRSFDFDNQRTTHPSGTSCNVSHTSDGSRSELRC